MNTYITDAKKNSTKLQNIRNNTYNNLRIAIEQNSFPHKIL